ncbi:hypothetical protein ACWZEH_33390 [Streptomyces sp. QTS137]
MHDTAVAALRQYDGGDPFGRIRPTGAAWRRPWLVSRVSRQPEARLRPVVATTGSLPNRWFASGVQ